MTAEELLRAAQAGEALPPLDGPLRALAEDARADWEAAHAAAQAGEDADSAWVHAYLHRKEGDLANAGYWYSRAGRVKPAGTLEEEWLAIARHLLAQAG
ncbi:hypothetical protein [Belnapia moabensis]|uniref:hypothetical protein n=1 Tax=Belnapia moabensis TaxID=365533 RepID=UPI0005BD9819|nr:hypothetical protein [Belnapia moabensis]